MRGNRQFKLDGNHNAVCAALRAVGASVQSIAIVGGGCPDVIAAKNGKTVLFEVKDGKKPPSQRRLTDDEFAWHAAWQGISLVVMSPEDAVILFLEAIQ